MNRAAGYAVGAIVLVVVVLAAADYSTRTAACMACHTREAEYADWMAARLTADKKGFAHELIACADCHVKGAPDRTFTSNFRGLLHAVQYLVPQIDPRRPTAPGLVKSWPVPYENCQSCHLGSIVRKAVQVRDLPPNMQQIGLVMDHRKHVLARDDTCARCHERYKEKEGADRGVNYLEVNHLGCDSCHSAASHAYRAGRVLPLTEKEFLLARDEAWAKLLTNPRWMVPIPTEQSCRRCHDGKIHFKTKIFLADCRGDDNFDNCVKCHPLMTREYFDKLRADSRTLTSAHGERDADG
jgi:hypothetical protein